NISDNQQEGTKKVSLEKKEKQPLLTKQDREYDSLSKIFPPTFKNKYVISVFLPLYLNWPGREETQKATVGVSRDFYKVLSLAADTLHHCGLKLDIHVFDSENNWTYNSVLDTLLNNHSDLVI